MALVKFNKSVTVAIATGSDRDANTLYFPTDEDSIYLGGKRVGGDRVSHAYSATIADSATTAGSATSAETANIANKANQLSNALTLKQNGGDTKLFDGSAAVTFDVTPSGIGAALEEHTHTLSQINGVGSVAERDAIQYVGDSSNIPTAAAVKAYVDSQIKNYTSAFRFAGRLNWVNNEWRVNDIPSDIYEEGSVNYMSLSDYIGNAADEGYMKVGHSFYVGVVSANPVDNTFSGEIVQEGDMVTCVNLYNEEGTYEPQYHVVNSNITVTESVDTSTKIPTSNAVKTAIDTAIEANKYTHPSYDATTGVPESDVNPGFGGTFQVCQIASNSQGHVYKSIPRTITIPQTLASENDRGLMSPTQFRNLNDVLDALTWK